MAESKSKKLKRFKATQHKARLKFIELSVKKEITPYLRMDQRIQMNGQIKKLGNKIQMYDRKIKELEGRLRG
ncbi:hypothetical protein [Psychrobacillus lasiicapitis]|uniref:Uncharacterized protein n=1 Tax=Psychrobacillus lasiicapitis TaxID=1636719 RepID=A0A544TA67_9BACI|nr:hypothetical protein [Psychrobacillus lasiicapitis]TQR14361.1 hypothetical protein FG382_07850 [Psychrobacillus lasiicapitis]GGA32014.1 hypothetical protein GCM10011384_21980 [Psychrobacillus lasiicapitis]